MDKALIPHQFVPEYCSSNGSSSSEYSSSDNDSVIKAVGDIALGRTGNTNWCLCDNWILLPSNEILVLQRTNTL